METLEVYLCNRFAGTLTRATNGSLGFQYDAAYLKSPDAAVLSSTLPLSDAPYGERDIAAFFSNLLPDESVRQRIAEILHLTPEDTFGLLRILGGDCAGAIAFYEPGRTPNAQGEPSYCELTDGEASALLRDLANRPLGIDDEVRWQIRIPVDHCGEDCPHVRTGQRGRKARARFDLSTDRIASRTTSGSGRQGQRQPPVTRLSRHHSGHSPAHPSDHRPMTALLNRIHGAPAER